MNGRWILIGSAIAVTTRLVVACAGEPDPDEALDTPDASVLPDTGTTDDASVDASVDAPIDTAPVCSKDDWCAIPLPSTYDGGPDEDPTKAPPRDLVGVWVAPDHTAWAISGPGGAVYRFDGQSWAVVTITGKVLNHVWGIGVDDLVIAGNEGGFVARLRRAPSGQVTLEDLSLPSPVPITGLRATRAGELWALTFEGARQLGTSGDGGPSWSLVPPPITIDGGQPGGILNRLWGTETELWASGRETTGCADDICADYAERPLLVRYRADAGPGDGGAASRWKPVTFDAGRVDDGYAPEIVAATAAPDGTLVLCQTQPCKRVFRGTSTDAGALAYTDEETTFTSGKTLAAWASAPNDAWLVGEFGTIRHFDGSAWSLSRTALSNVAPLSTHLRAIHGVVDANGKKDIWVVGPNLALRRTVSP